MCLVLAELVVSPVIPAHLRVAKGKIDAEGPIKSAEGPIKSAEGRVMFAEMTPEE